MTTQEAAKTESEHQEPSSWTRLPNTEGEDRRDSSRVEVRRAIEHGASEVAAVIGRGMRRATEMVGAPTSTEVESLTTESDLPELGANADTLGALALRLDREGDFWRALALKAMGRAAWADRTTHGASVIAAVGCAVLAGVAGMQALFGGGTWQKAVMMGAGTIALLAGAAVVGAAGSVTRRAQREISREALARADLVELRLHRVAVVLAVKKDDSGGYAEALRRLEREVTSPVR